MLGDKQGEEITQIVVSDPFDPNFEKYPPELLMGMLMSKDGIEVVVPEGSEDPEDYKDYLKEAAIYTAVAYALDSCSCQSVRRALTLKLIQSQNPTVQLSALGSLNFYAPYYISVEDIDVSIWNDAGISYRDEERERIDEIFQPLIRDSANPSVRQLAFDRYTSFARVALNPHHATDDLDGSVVMESLTDMVANEIDREDSNPQVQVQMILHLLSVAADQAIAPRTGVFPRLLASNFHEHWNALERGEKLSEETDRIVLIVNGFLRDLGHPIESLDLIRSIIFSPYVGFRTLRGSSPFSVDAIASLVKRVQAQPQDDPDQECVAQAVYEEGVKIIVDILRSTDERMREYASRVAKQMTGIFIDSNAGVKNGSHV